MLCNTKNIVITGLLKSFFVVVKSIQAHTRSFYVLALRFTNKYMRWGRHDSIDRSPLYNNSQLRSSVPRVTAMYRFYCTHVLFSFNNASAGLLLRLRGSTK